MAEELYSDGFANIVVTGTIVRIDLMALVGQDAEGKPKFEARRRLVMPLDGFLRSYGMADDVVNKLQKAGVINRRTPQEAGPTIQASTAPNTQAGAPSKKK
jgi:hypothetical protein